MSTRGQSAAEAFSGKVASSLADPPFPPMWRLAVGILTLFLINLVAIGAFLATAAVAAGENAAARSVFVTPGKMRSGALLLKSENAALASEASGQRGNSIVRADDTRPEAGSSARAALASEASGQRGNSIVRAPDTRPEPGSSAPAALASEASGQRGNSIVRETADVCCGGPAPAQSDACCAEDAKAKVLEKAGCGCGTAA